MDGNSTNIRIGLDADLAAGLDMNCSTVFNIFVCPSFHDSGIPFELKPEQPNKETIASMLDVKRLAKDPPVKGYNNLDELFAAPENEKDKVRRQVYSQV